MARTKNVRIVGAFEFDHPVIHFIFVRPVLWIGRVWLRMLVSKHHIWAMASPAPFRRLTYFGPANQPLQSRPASLLVFVGSAEKELRPEAAGDYEPATDKLD